MAFPASPSNGDEHTNGIMTWVYFLSDNRWDAKTGAAVVLTTLWELIGGYRTLVASPVGTAGLWQVDGSYVTPTGGVDTDSQWDIDGIYIVPAV